MRMIAYGIPILMLLPVVIWIVVQNTVIQGDANSAQISTGNWVSLGIGGIALVAAATLLARMILNSGDKS